MHDASGLSIAASVGTARSMVRAARSAPELSSSASDAPTDRCDVVVVGAGFAGMYMRYRIRQLGLTVRVFETGNGVGGTWYWNRYPGARVDGGSLSYSYGFDEDLQQEWSWSELFASQAELLAYANHIADRFDLRKDIQFSTTVKSARWCDSAKRWLVETDRDDRISAKYFITAVGCLSAANIPPFAGLDQFMGRYYHTARWPEDEVELAGKLIGVIGTGSTGMQIIPAIAEKAKHLYVFQRTPHYAIPSNNEPMDIEREQAWKAHYREHRAIARASPSGHDSRHLGMPIQSALEVTEAERVRAFEQAWVREAPALMLTFNDLRTNLEANELVAAFVRDKIRSTVKDSKTAELLCPKTYPIGAKRLCLEAGYYETFNRDNVALVDIKTHPIQEITRNGLRTTAAEYPLDTIIFATGFDAITGSLLRMNIVGSGRIPLIDKWHVGPRTYLGLMTAGFPNMFIITGPGSPSALVNLMTAIEQHVDWVTAALAYLREHGYTNMEATDDAEDGWVTHVNEIGEQSIFAKGNSWYLGANIPGKPQVFMPYAGGLGSYGIKCDEVAANGYEGFVLS